MDTSERVADRLRGVIAATVTPFRGPDLELDVEGMEANARWLRDRAVSTFVVNGSIGEASSLSREERAAAVSATARTLPADVLLIAGCSDADPREVLRHARDAADAGAHAFLVQPPYHFRLTQEECFQFFSQLDSEIDRPFILYDNPATGKTNLDPDTIERISRLRNFAAVKEADPDVTRFAELIERFGMVFPVIAAAEDSVLFMLLAGAPACMTASAAFAPEILTRVCTAVAAADLRAAHAEMSRVRAFRTLFSARTRAGLPAYLPYTKAAVELITGHAGPPRPPLLPITDTERQALARVLADEMGLVDVRGNELDQQAAGEPKEREPVDPL